MGGHRVNKEGRPRKILFSERILSLHWFIQVPYFTPELLVFRGKAL
jgi:hypothetical protein